MTRVKNLLKVLVYLFDTLGILQFTYPRPALSTAKGSDENNPMRRAVAREILVAHLFEQRQRLPDEKPNLQGRWRCPVDKGVERE